MTAETLTIAAVKSMTLVNLKQALKSRDLLATGNKAVLVERLTDYVQTCEAENAPKVHNDVVEHAKGSTSPPKAPASPEKLQPMQQQQPIPVKVVKVAAPPVVTEEDEEKAEAAAAAAAIEAAKSPKVDSLDAQVARAARFGTAVPADAKKEQRAQRFGTAVDSGIDASVGKESFTPEAKAKRAARFGMAVDPASENKPHGELSDAQKQRMLRFGTNDMTKTGKVDLSNTTSSVMKKRAERFGADAGSGEIDVKKSKRAERFAV